MPTVEESGLQGFRPAEAEISRKRQFGRPLLMLPLVLFASILVVFFLGLGLGDPSLVPSALIGKPVPAFSLPPVQGYRRGLSSVDLKGTVSLVNVFASWCVACREEHPLLMALKKNGTVPINGINYKDKPADAAKWLATMGNPYTRIGADLDGRVAIDWGVYGVPETFVISRDARISFKQIGPITSKVLESTILPLVARLRQKAPSARASGE